MYTKFLRRQITDYTQDIKKSSEMRIYVNPVMGQQSFKPKETTNTAL